ncbi:MAG: sulfotransferase [Alphaproteobacteria bacterium]
MRYLFIGGPGRSGTSFVADRLGAHPDIVTLKDIELKIFCEKNSLLDLLNALTETYSPNRAVMALDQFWRMAEALIEGGYGQPALTTAHPSADWRACFAAFTDSLLEDGHPAPQTAERFFEAARVLLRQIAALAADEHAAEDTVFLEKTPHNLLAIGFLARLAPGARFLHVMRDPRSIAWSLLAMRWGPDELTTAASWVGSYCRAWAAAEARAAGLGLPLIRLHIEEAATAPAAAGAWLTTRLGLHPYDGLFEGADPAMLNRWAMKADPAERTLLDARLGGWAAHFGYDPDHIGRRPGPATFDAIQPNADRTPEPVTP